MSIELRIRAEAGKRVSVAINGRAVGGALLEAGQTNVVSFKSASASLVQGENELLLSVSGAPRGGNDVLADVDWLRVAGANDDPVGSVPTRASSVIEATAAGVARRSFVLPSGSVLRCTGQGMRNLRAKAMVTVAEGTEADVELRRDVDRSPPAALANVHFASKEPRTWKPLSGELGTDDPVAVEIAVTRTSKGGRVYVGEPELVLEGEGPKLDIATPVRGVVMVVWSMLPSRWLGVYGGATALPAFDEIAKTSYVVRGHRAASSLSSAAMASMLTSRSVRGHAVRDEGARLPASTPIFATAARQGNVRTAFFSANPFTGPAFGFDRGWETYKFFPPTEPNTAVHAFEEAARFVEAHKGDRFLVVIHARGIHPPWDVVQDAVAKLPPAGYTGPIEGRTAAELLAKKKVRIGDPDKERALALAGSALLDQDAALGKLVAVLRAQGRAGDTAFVMTSDAGYDENASVPLVDSDTLEESALDIPFVVALPGQKEKKEVLLASSSVDVALLVLALFGLAPPTGFEGRRLDRPWALDDVWSRARVARLGSRLSLRSGVFTLTSNERRSAKLCALALEPACVVDVRGTHPLATELLTRLLARELRGESASREPATVDPATAASLKSWGR